MNLTNEFDNAMTKEREVLLKGFLIVSNCADVCIMIFMGEVHIYRYI